MNKPYDIDPSLVDEILYNTSVLLWLENKPSFALFSIAVAVFISLMFMLLITQLSSAQFEEKAIFVIGLIFLISTAIFFPPLWKTKDTDGKPTITETVKPDYIATAALTPGAQCPYLPDEPRVGVDTTWAHDGCVIYNDNGDIVETITIRALPHGTSYAVKDELFSIKHGVKITDEERSAPIVNPDPMIDSQGHARAIYIDNDATLSSTRMEKLPEQLTISISVDNHSGDTDTARKHLYAVREHLGLT